jgi:CobQ-like glutamine amidotransferase family enzyme
MVVDEGVIVEIVRPGTGDPVPDGEVGEVVVTTLNPDYPLIRFATGDLSAVLPGQSPCGRTNMRIKGWMGRADQTTKIKGMFVRPEQVAALVARHDCIARARVIASREGETDVMTVRIEAVGGEAEHFAGSVIETLKLKGRIEIVPPGKPLPVEADLILLPGTKSTTADLAFLRAQGWDIDIAAALRRGARVLGLCGGYQMLGQTIADPDGTEGTAGIMPGLGLLAVDTVMHPDKRVTLTDARHAASGEPLRGYEIHIGRTTGPDCARPLFDIDGVAEGATRADGRVMGSYLHGMFAADGFRRAFLAGLGAAPGTQSHDATVEATLDALADHLERCVDCDGLLAVARAGV